MGLADHNVTAMGIVRSFEEQMMTSEEDWNLVIRALLMKDYPILLWLNSTRYVFLPIGMKGGREASGVR